MKVNNKVNIWKTIIAIIANKELERYTKGKRVSGLKIGNLQIEVDNREQVDKLRQIKYLNNISDC